MFDIIKFEPGNKYKIDVSYFDFRPMLHQRLIDKFLERHLERDKKNRWHVCYQDEGQGMIWSKFKEEKEARKMYETYKGEKAARMLYRYKVVEEDGDKKLTDEMKEYA